MIRPPPRSTRTDTLFPYTTLFRSGRQLNGWRFELRHLHAKSASQSRFSDFALHIRAIVRSQSLPGYVLELVPGTGSETLLVMRPSVIEIGLRPVDNLPRQKRRIGTSDAMPIGTSTAVLSVLRTLTSPLNLWPSLRSDRRIDGKEELSTGTFRWE